MAENNDFRIEERVDSRLAQSTADAWNKLEIHEEIARGGMGIVYRATHKALQCQCAVKVLSPQSDSQKSVQRFLNEARLICSLHHANIVRVLTAGFDEAGKPFLVMEWLEGKTLDIVLAEKGKLHLKEFFPIFKQILSAVRYAHDNQVIHRDLKPGNIFLLNLSDTAAPTVKLLDFGIARIIEADGSELQATRTAALSGTPSYMSPEATCGGLVDQRSDVYSIGTIMYEMLVGEPPFSGENALEVMYKQSKQPVDQAKLPDSRSCAGLKKCILKCLEKDAEKRYQTVADLEIDFEEAAQQCEKLPQELPARKFAAGKKTWAVIAGATVLSVASVFYLIPLLRDSHKPGASVSGSARNTSIVSPQTLATHARQLMIKHDDLKRQNNTEEADRYKEKAMELLQQCSHAAEVRIRPKAEAGNKNKLVSVGPGSISEKRLNNDINLIWNVEMQMGKIRELDGQLAEAEKHYARAIAINAEHYLRSQALREHTEVLRKQGRLNDAIKELQGFLKKPSALGQSENILSNTDQYFWQNSTTQLKLANMLRETHRFAEAKQAFLETLKLISPCKTPHPARKAEALVGPAGCQSDPREKARCFLDAYSSLCNPACSEDPESSARACFECAHFFESLDKVLARKAYEKSIELGKYSNFPGTIADVLKLACEFENDAGQFALIEKLCGKARAESPDPRDTSRMRIVDGYPLDCESNYAQGVSNFLQKDSTAAISCFKKSVLQAESGRDIKPRVEWMLGRCYFANANKKEALEHFDRALRLARDLDFLNRRYMKAGHDEYAQLLIQAGRYRQGG